MLVYECAKIYDDSWYEANCYWGSPGNTVRCVAIRQLKAYV